MRRLGAGGMGTVYYVHPTGGVPLAVKVLHPEFAADPVHRRRFAREVATLTKVSGPYLLELTAADARAERPWLATPYVAGNTLAEHIQAHGPLTGAALVTFAAATAHALACVHHAGVAHRDLKPANVILAADGPRVVDFGIAHHLDATAVTATRMTTGTPGWMAPEQLERAATGTASDLFTWGILIAYAATGQHPFGAPTGIEYRIINAQPQLDGLPPALRPLAAAALAKDPAARPSAAELLTRTAALHGPAGAASFPTPGNDRPITPVPLPAALWSLPTAVSTPGPGVYDAPTATAVPARTDPRAQLLAVLEEVDETSREASRSIEGLSKCLTDTKIRTEALLLNRYLDSLGNHAVLAASRIRAGDDARGAQRLHEMLRKDPRKALKTVTYFRGPGAPMLVRAGYQGNGLDATERLISTIRDALPALADYIARHDSDFPELSATTAMAWTTAAAPPHPTSSRTTRWWRLRTSRRATG
ncbi:protein kinase domain-containing protein [Streptomyces sp. NPDC003362]